jgi:hypothetical protein
MHCGASWDAILPFKALNRSHAPHPVLAGLTAAMYLSPEGVVPNPDRSAGLYIKTRHGAIVQVSPRVFACSNTSGRPYAHHILWYVGMPAA